MKRTVTFREKNLIRFSSIGGRDLSLHVRTDWMVDNENLKNGRINIYLSMAIAYIDSPLSNKINMVHDPLDYQQRKHTYDL